MPSRKSSAPEQLGLHWDAPGLVAGVDEAGRGPLAGPVVAAAVILDELQPIRGLADQMDIALTQQRYEAVLANRIDEPWVESVQLVGRQCESGDLLVDGADFPEARVGDLVLMATTGAYAYTMSNNYNGALKPAIVFVQNGEARLVTRRETYDDLLATHAPALDR